MREEEPADRPDADQPTVTFVPIRPAGTPGLDTPGDVDGLEGFALVVDRGPRAGMTFELEEGETTIGRGEDQDILLDDVTVSRNHAVMLVRGDQIEFKDVGSTNGTYINGERLDKAVLAPGDEVIIGKFHLLVAHGDG